ncbi:MAG: glycosyltransferase family 4 protein [Candidatus Moranbacteria bacterium]|nr:glycosyltransferase family 4 protein [Candidatus Moranbacteria bacterium]
MKILVIAPTPFFADRGTHIRILEEALALEKRGHKITIATYHIGKDIDANVQTEVDVRRIRRLLFWYKKLEAGPDWQKILLDIMLIRKAFNLARTQKPDIIHGHLHEGVLIGWIVKTVLFWRKMKLVADFHGSLTKEMVSHSYLNGGPLKKIFCSIERWVNNLGDSAMASSEELAKDIALFRTDHQVSTILDGANLAHYSNLPSKIELKKEFELPLDKTIVTYTGALMGNKGIEYLLQAIPEVLKKTPNAYFVVAGFPAENVVKFVSDNGLSASVRVISPLDYFDLSKILMASDIGVDPKDSTTLQASGKILQYMAAGLGVVCFDRPNNRAYLGNGAEYAQEISAAGLTEAIIKLVNDQEKTRFQGEFNKKQIEKFSWDLSSEKIEEIYFKQ